MESACVLIVDDDPMIAMVAETNLRDAGFDVCGIADTELGAIELAALHKPAFALIDVRLKDGDGLAVAKHLMDEHGTRILVASGEVEAVNQAGSRGVSGFAIVKPYDPALVPVAFTLMQRFDEGEDVNLPDWLTRI